MNRRLILLIVIFASFGTAIALRGSAGHVRPTEAWLESQVPLTVGDFQMQRGPTSTATYSYKMDETTYKILDPYGIVCRTMSDGHDTYDTVVIASDNAHSFHDPRVCFASQYNEILNQTVVQVPTKTLGSIPMMLLVLKDEHFNKIRLAAYAFRGPSGLQADASGESWDMLFTEFRTGKRVEGAFYRFISDAEGQGDAEKSALLEYAGNYMDEIHKTSGGRF